MKSRGVLLPLFPLASQQVSKRQGQRAAIGELMTNMTWMESGDWVYLCIFSWSSSCSCCRLRQGSLYLYSRSQLKGGLQASTYGACLSFSCFSILALALDYDYILLISLLTATNVCTIPNIKLVCPPKILYPYLICIPSVAIPLIPGKK